MPFTPRVPPYTDRFFARIDRFECACPNCGQLVFASLDQRDLPARLQSNAHRRREHRLHPRHKRIWNAVWNPCTQRLACPWCGRAFMIGLLAYPVAPGGRRPLAAPPDVEPTRDEQVEMARLGGSGWYTEARYRPGQHVNVAVTNACSCPEQGWSVTCPVHGDPAAAAPPAANS